MKLTKSEVAQRDQFNQDLEGLHEELTSAITNYNSKLEEARAFTVEVHDRLSTAFGDKSETWQESDKGQAASDFVSAWEDIDLVDVDVDASPLPHEDFAELPIESEE